VTITEGASPTVEISGEDVLCAGSSVVLTATSNAPILWNTGATTSSITVNTAGLYTVTASNACGSDSDGQTVTASPLNASFTATPSSGTAPLTVQFNNASTSGSTSAWDFDGPGTSSAVSPSFTFEGTGVYEVVLEVTLDGCVAEASAMITVGQAAPGTASSISIPNVFTPNNDRVNDVLSIQAVNIVSVEVLIYNRWGQKVNELRRVGEVWDARSMSGNVVPDGTYFYTLTALGADGVEHSASGHITLVR
ncbi:MAG: gliding motility-associated C-terminal domain-containing protein, partial [Flavobacteriales bacterium]|nr:gliding motility-associated C-terminal domain-containing protein [Flavobacteriales bacterium]